MSIRLSFLTKGKEAMNHRIFILSLASVLMLAGLPSCSVSRNPKLQRFAWITGLKPDKAAYYKELHANPWPGVLKTLKEHHIQNSSIHLKEIDGKQYLFYYLEYTGDNFDDDMKKMAADPEIQRWWKETNPCQLPLPEAAAKGKIWTDMEEVFFLP
jgi:L-rhamnose mutarotase